jgi:hypothetical protein
MLIDTERVHAGPPARGPDAAGGLGPEDVPGCVPGHPQLVRQGRDRRVEMLERVGRPDNGPGGESRPWPGQRVFLRECRPRAARVRAVPHTLGPQQPHRPAETRNVVEADLAAPVADRDDAAIRVTYEILAGLNT